MSSTDSVAVVGCFLSRVSSAPRLLILLAFLLGTSLGFLCRATLPNGRQYLQYNQYDHNHVARPMVGHVI